MALLCHIEQAGSGTPTYGQLRAAFTESGKLVLEAVANWYRVERVGFARLRKAEELARRAGAVGSGGISSDDPDAPDKLRQKVAELQARRDRMKQVNAHWRKHGTIDGLEMGEDERHRIRENQRIWGGLRGPPTP